MALRSWTPLGSACVLLALASGGLALAPGAVPATATPAAQSPTPAAVAPHPITAAELAGHTRLLAGPGDYALSNERITAVVRSRTGALTELWPAAPTLPSAPQLGVDLAPDALWSFEPAVFAGGGFATAVLDRAVLLGDAIEVRGVAQIAGARLEAVTRYTLMRGVARLDVSTTWSLLGDAAPSADVELGDRVRWGNAAYVTDAPGAPRMKFRGEVSYVGRRGASGDLVLRPGPGQALIVDYGATFRGAQGALSAIHHRGAPLPGAPVTVTRSLAFEALPRDTARARLEGLLTIDAVDELGAALPAKVRFDRVGSDAPPFEDFGGLDGADHFAWTGSGHLERALPVGEYTVLVSAGLERDVVRRSVRVQADRPVSFTARLPRVIDTAGWVGADLHLHQSPSVDADLGLAERVVAIAAEGVELAVATDHYAITDLAPTVTALRQAGLLARDVQTLRGSEVSTLGRRFGHFNVFPLQPGARLVYEDTTPSELFAAARAASPDGLLQVNHPRMDPSISYFAYFALDTEHEASAVPGYDPGYDAIEVYNGDEARDLKDVQRVFADWLHLLGRGRRYTGTGSSDSHQLAFLDPGTPRTFVRWSFTAGDGDDVRAPAGDVVTALRAGHAVVTSGPWLQARVGDAGPGDAARAMAGHVRLEVTVDAAPWIDVSRVEIFVGGSARARRRWLVPRARTVRRLHRTVTLDVTAPSFIVVSATGERGLPTAAVPGTQPFAFTNPIWIDP